MARTKALYWIVLLLIMSACSGTPNAVPTLPPTAPPVPTSTHAPTREIVPTAVPTDVPPPAHLRIIHAAQGAPTLTIYAGFNAIATNLDAGQATDPTTLAAGDYVLKALPSGSNPNDPPLTTTALTLTGGESLLLLITGKAASLQIQAIPETQIALNTGESAVTLVNALNQPIRLTAGDDNTLLIPEIQPGTSGDSNPVAPGEQHLTIRSGDTALANFAVTLEDRQQHIEIISGTPQQVTITSLAKPAPGRSSLRVINTALALQPLDLYIDGTVLEAAVSYGRPTARQNTTSGSHLIAIYAAGTDPQATVPLLQQELPLEAGNIALVVMGETDSLRLVTFSEDLTPTGAGQARIALLNTLPQFNNILVLSGNSGLPGINELYYGDAPRTTILNATLYSLTFISGSQTVELAENISLDAGRSYLYLVTGRLDSPPLVISDNVGQNTAASTGDGNQRGAALIRYINAINGTPVQFSLNDNSQPTTVDSNTGSPFVEVVQRSITLQAEQDGVVLATTDATFEAGERYTIVLHPSTNQTEFLITRDDEALYTGNTPHVRFINLSGEANQSLGLAFVTGKAGTPEASVTGTPDGVEGSTLPFGIQQILDQQRGSSISNTILMPEGVFNFFVTFSDGAHYQSRIGSITLKNGTAGDVVATETGAFYVPYPAVSG